VVEGSQTLREGRDRYFADNGLPPDGGYQDRWVVIRVGGVPVSAFPNTRDRRENVPAHDLHHVLTGYPTDLRGEAEIGAFELASGCASSRAALVLNTQVFGNQLPFHWARLKRAFVRGHRSRNLYGGTVDDALLSRTVGEMRDELGIDADASEPRPEERRAFRRRAGMALATTWGPIVPLGALAWWIWG
jgi:hypothetical protein